MGSNPDALYQRVSFQSDKTKNTLNIATTDFFKKRDEIRYFI